jgi:hypothetical protein
VRQSEPVSDEEKHPMLQIKIDPRPPRPQSLNILKYSAYQVITASSPTRKFVKIINKCSVF